MSRTVTVVIRARVKSSRATILLLLSSRATVLLLLLSRTIVLLLLLSRATVSPSP